MPEMTKLIKAAKIVWQVHYQQVRLFLFLPVRNSVKFNYKWNPFKYVSLED